MIEDKDKLFIKNKLDNFKEMMNSDLVKDEVTQNYLINGLVSEIFRESENEKYMDFIKVQNKIKQEVIEKQKKILDIINEKPETKLQNEINELVTKYRGNTNNIYKMIIAESEKIDKDHE